MKRATVDLVVTGDEREAAATAVDAVRRGQRVLVVLRSDDARVVSRLRRLCRASKNQLTVMTNAEVVCVDGIGGVEAVVVRYARTGRLCAVNTPAFLSCDGSMAGPGGTDAGRRSTGARSGYPCAMVALFTRLVSLCLIASIPVLLTARDAPLRATVLNHVAVIDMTERAIQRDMAVLIRGDLIAAIERAAGFTLPGARVMDLTGTFLIPALVDMHHHLDTGASTPGPPIPGQGPARDVCARI